MVSQVRSQCKNILVNKALVLSVRRHHARVTHQIMLLVLSSAGARGALKVNGLVAALDLIKPMVRGEFLVMATCGYSRYVGGPCGSSI